VAEAVARRWVKRDLDEQAVKELADSLKVSFRSARLLVRRGVTDPETARRYLSPRLTDLPDPFLMKGLERAATRLADAIANRERVTLYADYDVDGVTSASLLASFLRLHGLDPAIYIPKRLIEGYGLNREAVEKIAADGARVMVTLDCGITAADEIARANDLGIDCIVVDHHRCPPDLPPAYATLNPQQADCPYPEKVLAAVGVTFNLAIGLRKVLRERGWYPGEQPNLRRHLDLVAMGTVCDMVPLVGVNRTLAWYGLEELRWARRSGVRALMEVSKVRAQSVSSADIGYKLGPRINAAGRLSDATVGVRLLLTDDIKDARKLADALDAANGNRKLIEGDVLESAIARIDGMASLPHAIVLADETWHPGVVGIVASKLVERYDRPTVLIGEGGRGSARSARNVHLYDAISDCADHLTKFGGHRAAAGLRIAFKNVELFARALADRVEIDPDFKNQFEATLIYDDELHPADVDDSCFKEIQQLEPFGNGNPEPLFRMTNVRVKNARMVGGEHLKMRLEEGRFGGLEAIAFKRGDVPPDSVKGRPIDLACHLEKNEYAGLWNLELRIRDLRTLEDVL
jgi:single-stranded-DNA-specific exonuclease